MVQQALLPLPYILTIRLVIRDAPDDTTGEVPNIEPEPVTTPFKYPPWAFGVGTLVVFMTCLFFAFLCSGINRRLHRKAMLKAQFPCLGAGMGVVSCLATGTSAAAAALAMPTNASKIGMIPIPDEPRRVVVMKAVKTKIQDLKIPATLPRVFKTLGRRKHGDNVCGILFERGIELRQMGKFRAKSELVPTGDTAGWMKDGEGVWIWDGGGGKGPQLAGVGEGEPVIVERLVGRDEEDSIGFVTAEERVEDVDANKDDIFAAL